MDFYYTAEEEAFRNQLRKWLEENLPHGWGTAGFKIMPTDSEEEWQFLLQWHKKLYEGGWVGLSWPKEYGGRGASLMEQVIFDEEMERYKAPPSLILVGLFLVGPILMQFGTEEQKKRCLPKILSGEEIWCQGFSEPDAGSDLAAISTKAVEEGDYFVVNGQKVWTSLAQRAHRCILLVRTDPSAPKHKGISYLLMDMKSPGITVRPLVQMSGDAEFNEMFLEDVRIPKQNLVGEKNQGWYIAMATLSFERTGAGTQFMLRQNFDGIVKLAKNTYRQGRPISQDPIIRQKLAQIAIELEIMKYNSYRTLTTLKKGGTPGPEASIGKLFWSELNQRIMEVAMDIEGTYCQLMPGSKWVVADGLWQYHFLRSRGNTIEQGTSEIQRNTIGERVLGLPR